MLTSSVIAHTTVLTGDAESICSSESGDIWYDAEESLEPEGNTTSFAILASPEGTTEFTKTETP